jgi:DNA repair protein RadA/Sms
VEQRITEAEKLGFETIYISKFNKMNDFKTSIQIKLVAKIEDVVSELFG